MITQAQFLTHMNISAPAWAAGIINFGDYVTSSNVIYQCTVAHTAAGSFDATKFTSNTVALQCVNAAINYVNRLCNRDFRSASYTDEFTGEGTTSHYVNNFPITTLTSIKSLNTDTGDWEDIFTSPDTIADSAKSFDAGKILLLKGYTFSEGVIYQVVYTGGYADGASPVNETCLEVAQDFWNNSAASGQSILGLSSENLGGQSSNGKGFNPESVSTRFEKALQTYRVPNV